MKEEIKRNEKIQGKLGETCNKGTVLLLGPDFVKIYGSRKHTMAFLGRRTSMPNYKLGEKNEIGKEGEDINIPKENSHFSLAEDTRGAEEGIDGFEVGDGSMPPPSLACVGLEQKSKKK
jgi:hypothetical protein